MNKKDKFKNNQRNSGENFTIDPVNISFGEYVILQNTKLTIEYGEHYALIGRNGVGKTSLLNSIYNRELQIPENLDMIYVKQEQDLPNTTVLKVLLLTDFEKYKKYSRLEELELLFENDEINDKQIEEMDELSKEVGNDCEKYKAKAYKILNGLGFTIDDQNKDRKSTRLNSSHT